MKPDPGNPQELYLGSLEALGIDTQAHDIRFVEDNWVWMAHLSLNSPVSVDSTASIADTQS